MSRLNVPSDRVLACCLAAHRRLFADRIAAAGCSDSARFDSNPTPRAAPAAGRHRLDRARARRTRVEAQPLPAPSRPATVAVPAALPRRRRVSALTARQRAHRSHRLGAGTAPPPPAGHWTWDGGSPVTVGHGETVETIARKYGVPASAIMETNGITSDGARSGPASAWSFRAMSRRARAARRVAPQRRRSRAARRPRACTSSRPAKA